MPAVTDKLVPPPVVRKYLDSLIGQPDYPPEVLAEIEQTLNLSYHHGGGYIWARGRGPEREVLFAGTIDETATWAESLDQETLLTMALAYIPTWKQTKSELGLRE